MVCYITKSYNFRTVVSGPRNYKLYTGVDTTRFLGVAEAWFHYMHKQQRDDSDIDEMSKTSLVGSASV